MKITRKLLEKMVREEFGNMREDHPSNRSGGPQSADSAMREIAGLVKSGAAQSRPDQAIEIIRGIVLGWQSTLGGDDGDPRLGE